MAARKKVVEEAPVEEAVEAPVLGDNITVEQEQALKASDREITSLAYKVMAGSFGVGEARKAKLGANYDAVTARVRELRLQSK